MNIFKLLGFRKILFFFLKACLIMAFNMFFLLILIDEFISLPLLANIIWVRFIYFPLFYSILFYLFCFYLRKDLNNIDKLPKIKLLKKKKRFLEKFKNNYRKLNKKDNIKKNILIREKVIYSDFKTSNFNKQDKILKNKQIEYSEEKNTKKIIDKKEILVLKKEKAIKKNIISQKKKISKGEIASKFFLILFCVIGCLIIILINPWSYLLFIFLFVLWNIGGLFGKLLTIFLLLTILGSIGILFFGTDEERENFFNSNFN